MRTYLNKLWLILTEPPDSIQDPEFRLNTRWLTTILASLLPFGILVAALISIITVNPQEGGGDIDFMVSIGGVVFWFSAYLLSRAGHYKAAVLLATTIGSVVIFIAAIGDKDIKDLNFLLFTILVNGMLLSTRTTFIIIFINIIAIVVIPFVFGGYSIRNIVLDALNFNLIGSVLAILIFRHRDTLERYRTQVLSQTNINLQKEVNERKQAEADLRQSEEKYSTLFQHSDSGIVIYDLQGTIIDVNRKALEMFGYTEAQWHSLNIYKLFTTEQTHLAQSSPLDYVETQLKRQNGELFPAEISANRIQIGVQPVTQIIIRDITERKQAKEHELALAVEKEKVRILADFVQNASHDFRTPLATINTSIYLLQNATDLARKTYHLRVLETQSAHLANLVDSLFIMARLDSEPQFSLESVILNSLVQNIRTKVQTLLEEKHLTLNVNLQHDLPQILANQGELDQAFKHLIDNAIQYTPAGGSITIETYVKETQVVVEISDTGIGISEADLPFVFDRFYRADKARSIETGGTGLGLSIATKIIKLHGGSITAESQLEQGSLFRIVLPIYTPAHPYGEQRCGQL